MPGGKKEEKAVKEREDLDDFISEEPGGEDEMDVPEEDAARSPAEDDAGGAVAEEVAEKEEEREDILDVAADVPVQVVAVMGKKTVTMKELVTLRMGEVVELGRPANEVVDLVAGGKLVAKGELVEIEGKLGVRIVKMIR